MKLRVTGPPRLHAIPLALRMPFGYGVANVTALPHVFVSIDVEVNGRAQRGVSAENLPPKWFTKDPHESFESESAAMRAVIHSAGARAAGAGECKSVFQLWQRMHEAQSTAAGAARVPPLLAGFGVSLIERAVIDAFCRATNRAFHEAVQTNALGIRLAELHPELSDALPADLLPPQPLRSLVIRHTVGLADPLSDGEIAADARLDDGLPQSLEACVAAYGLTHFKIKLSGDAAHDAARLRDVARVLQSVKHVAFTLDANENYRDVEPLKAFWRSVKGEPFMARLLFLEQPLHRDVAMSTDLNSWHDRPPIIIDESDDAIDSGARALQAGYHGVSYKGCKGVIKGIANACLAAHRGAIISAEDLTTVGPVGLLQDLAVIATLGIPHAERNGHHYVRGLTAFPADVRDETVDAHGDLYVDAGFPTLDIHRGAIAIGTVVDAPFGVGFEFDANVIPRLDL